MAMPMNQAKMTIEEQDLERPNLAKHFKHRLTTDAGFMYTSRKDVKMVEQSAEARAQLFEELWNMVRYSSLLPVQSPNLKNHN